MTPWAHALRVSFVESVGCCDTNVFPKTKTLPFHLTPYGKIRVVSTSFGFETHKLRTNRMNDSRGLHILRKQRFVESASRV
jgi:hypothetical protein